MSNDRMSFVCPPEIKEKFDSYIRRGLRAGVLTKLMEMTVEFIEAQDDPKAGYLIDAGHCKIMLKRDMEDVNNVWLD